MDKTLIWASRIVGLVPGVAVLLKGFGCPPEREKIFGGFIEGFGALALIIVEMNRGRLRSLSRAAATRLTWRVGALALALFVVYFFLIDFCIVRLTGRSPVYFPIVVCASLAHEIEEAGSRAALVERWGAGGAEDAIHQCSDSWLAGSTAALLLLYVGSFVALIVALSTAAAAVRREPK